MSLNDGAKEVGKWRKYTTFASGTDGRTALCRLGVCRARVVCRNCASLLRQRGWVVVHVFNELFVTAHVDDILNTDSNK